MENLKKDTFPIIKVIKVYVIKAVKNHGFRKATSLKITDQLEVNVSQRTVT